MSLRFFEGFDWLLYDDWGTMRNRIYQRHDQPYWPDNVSDRLVPETGRYGQGYALIRKYSGVQFIRKIPNLVGTTLVMGFALKPQGTDYYGRAVPFGLMSNGQQRYFLCYNPSYLLQVCKGDGTVIATATKQLTYNRWQYCEVKLFIDSRVGAVQFRIDEEQAGYSDNLNTFYIDNLSSINQVCLFGNWAGAGEAWGTQFVCDDMYALDGSGDVNNDFLGDVRVTSYLPTGAGGASDFTPSPAVPNWQNVDDSPSDGDGTYNWSETVGARDTFLHAINPSPASSAIVFGVSQFVYAHKSDGPVKRLDFSMRAGGNYYEAGDPRTQTADYWNMHHLWEKDPSTGLLINLNDLKNTLEFGYRVST